jgi:hypothetical protein
VTEQASNPRLEQLLDDAIMYVTSPTAASQVNSAASAKVAKLPDALNTGKISSEAYAKLNSNNPEFNNARLQIQGTFSDEKGDIQRDRLTDDAKLILVARYQIQELQSHPDFPTPELAQKIANTMEAIAPVANRYAMMHQNMDTYLAVKSQDASLDADERRDTRNLQNVLGTPSWPKQAPTSKVLTEGQKRGNFELDGTQRAAVEGRLEAAKTEAQNALQNTADTNVQAFQQAKIKGFDNRLKFLSADPQAQQQNHQQHQSMTANAIDVLGANREGVQDAEEARLARIPQKLQALGTSIQDTEKKLGKKYGIKRPITDESLRSEVQKASSKTTTLRGRIKHNELRLFQAARDGYRGLQQPATAAATSHNIDDQRQVEQRLTDVSGGAQLLAENINTKSAANLLGADNITQNTAYSYAIEAATKLGATPAPQQPPGTSPMATPSQGAGRGPERPASRAQRLFQQAKELWKRVDILPQDTPDHSGRVLQKKLDEQARIRQQQQAGRGAPSVVSPTSTTPSPTQTPIESMSERIQKAQETKPRELKRSPRARDLNKQAAQSQDQKSKGMKPK